MFEKVVAVNKEVHARTKVRELTNFGFTSGLHVAYVTMQEFTRAAPIFPIVFIEDKEKDEFRPVALLGLQAGQNLFVDDAGKWMASYVPAIIRRYPFTLAPVGNQGEYLVCIDEGSSLVNENEGAALFDEKGQPTEVINHVRRYLSELHQLDAETRNFATFLARHNLFTPLTMSVRDSGKVQNVVGCYVINEERLNNLSDELFLEIRKKRYLPAVFGHLISLAQTERLAKLQDDARARAA